MKLHPVLLFVAATCVATACTTDFDQFFQGPAGAGAFGGTNAGGGGTGGTGGTGGCNPDDCPAGTTCYPAVCDGDECGYDEAPIGTACTETGGKVCDGIGNCVECNDESDCESDEVCTQQNVCVPEQCANNTIDGDETDVDCGGTICPACDNGLDCLLYSDCESWFCDKSGAGGGGGGGGGGAGTGVCAPCGDDDDCLEPPDEAWCDSTDDSGTCVVKKGLGEACETDHECLSGFCPGQDGVCCDAACDGDCEACLGSKTGGSDGTCALVSAGTDPDDECLGADVCTAAGSCECEDGNHNGNETDVDCGGSVCPGCANGLDCSQGSDCLSSNCPTDDGVCCDAACAGTCEACLASKSGGTDGICEAVPPGEDPDSDCQPTEKCDGAGTCVDECMTNSCLDDGDCTQAATSGDCTEIADDCDRSICVNLAPGPPIWAGIEPSEDLSTWQADTQSDDGGNRWYCNVTLPVTQAGTLTDWQLFVDNNSGQAGDAAELVVIRCTSGGGGANGPVLSGCNRVGSGPSGQQITGQGLNSLSLAGSSQLDGATPDPTGIVVQAGDYICADSDDYDIRIDCNGSANSGGCPGPDFDTQYRDNLDWALEPVTLVNSSWNGVLMLRASGTATPTGHCSDTEPEPDTTTCNVSGGDTCCSGTCIVGPSGQGTCS